MGETFLPEEALKRLVQNTYLSRTVKGIGWTRMDLIKPEEQNRYWEVDFSYVWTGEGNAYLGAVIDGWDRDIVGDVFSDRCRTVEAYRNDRLHQSLDYMSPVQYVQSAQKSILLVA